MTTHVCSCLSDSTISAMLAIEDVLLLASRRRKQVLSLADFGTLYDAYTVLGASFRRSGRSGWEVRRGGRRDGYKDPGHPRSLEGRATNAQSAIEYVLARAELSLVEQETVRAACRVLTAASQPSDG